MEMKVKILSYVLEDDRETLDMIEDLLKANGISDYELFTKSEDMLIHIQGDIVLCVLDYYLDGRLSGLDILKEIKKRNSYSYIIVMSGQANCKIVIDCLNAGANKYIDKNEPDYLNKLIEYMLEGLQEARKRFELLTFLETRMKKRNIAIDDK